MPFMVLELFMIVTLIHFLVGAPVLKKCSSNFCLVLLSLSKAYRHFFESSQEKSSNAN